MCVSLGKCNLDNYRNVVIQKCVRYESLYLSLSNVTE